MARQYFGGWADQAIDRSKPAACGRIHPAHSHPAVRVQDAVLRFHKRSPRRPRNNGGEPLTSEDAFEKAQALSRGGDYRSAVRYLYLSSLLLLDERGLLRYDRTKTNREYLRSISRSPGLAKPLGEVIEVFDDVWYGYHSLEEETFKHYSDRVQELKENKG